MLKGITTALLISTLFITVQGQTYFTKYFGQNTCYEEGVSVEPNADGYLVSGAYNCTGGMLNWDSYLLQLDQHGDTLWQTKGLSVNGYMKPTADGNLIFAGGEHAGFLYDTIKVIKAEPNGTELWSTSIKYGLCQNRITDIELIADGYIVSGTYGIGNCAMPEFETFIAKLDLAGNLVWDAHIKAPMNQQVHDITVLTDGSIMGVGFTDHHPNGSAANKDMLLVKVDNRGIILFTKQYGNEYDNWGYGITETHEGGILTNGYTNQLEITRFDDQGNILWKQEYNSTCGGQYFKIAKTSDQAYAVLGSDNTNGNCEAVFMKIDTKGSVIWKKNWTGRIREFKEKADGSFVLTGYDRYLPDVMVILFDSTRLSTPIAPITNNPVNPNQLIGQVTLNPVDQDVAAILDSMDIETSIDETNYLSQYSVVSLYPNPANSQVTIEFSNPDRISYNLEIFDITGSLVARYEGIDGEKFQFDRNNMISGAYFYQLSHEQHIYAGKFMFQ